MSAGLLLPLTNRHGRFQAVHFRHFDVHQDDVKPPFACEDLERLAAVSREANLVPYAFENAQCVGLIDGIVFGKQDAEVAARLGERMSRNQFGLTGCLTRGLTSQGGLNCLQQLGLPDGLGQIGPNAKLAAAGGVAPHPG